MADNTRDRRERPERLPAASAERQRAITERLLLAALHEQDLTRGALEEGSRARFLASASRELAQSLDGSLTEEAIARRSLPRGDSWCIVDIIELDGAMRRLPIAHPDVAKQELAQTFADRRLSGPNLAHRPARLNIAAEAIEPEPEGLGGAGFGRLLVVPLAVRGTVLGMMTFVTREGDPPFSPDEVALASNIADLSALSLDNARLYRESQALRIVADEANRAKSTFLGNMSHELMTPLNAIGGYVTLIEMGLRGPVSEQQHVDLARIRQNQSHLIGLITELLTFAQSEGGRLEYHVVEVSAQAAMREVANMLQAAVDERHVTLVRRFAAEDEMLWADPDRVRQILLNLVMNAIKYGTAAGGTITIESRTTPDTVDIHVEDDGPGVPQAMLGAIFDPFVQLPGGAGARRGGVGLGLAISRDLARAMGGDLTVQSTIGSGSGSRFTLTLPRPLPGTDAASPRSV